MNKEDLSRVINFCESRKVTDVEIYEEDTKEFIINFGKNQTNELKLSDKGVGIRTIFGNKLGYSSSTMLNLDHTIKLLEKSISNSVFNISNEFKFSENIKFYYNRYIKPFDRKKVEDIIMRAFPRDIFNTEMHYIEKKCVLTTYSSIIENFLSYYSIRVTNTTNNEYFMCFLKELDDTENLKYGMNRNMFRCKEFNNKYDIIELRSEVNCFFLKHLGHNFIYSELHNQINKINNFEFSPILNLLDDGEYDNITAFPFYDSEGTERKKNYLIQDGKIKTFLYNRLDSFYVGTKPTGNAFRRDYHTLPKSNLSTLIQQDGDIISYNKLKKDLRLIVLESVIAENSFINNITGEFKIFVRGYNLCNDVRSNEKTLKFEGNYYDIYASLLAIGGYNANSTKQIPWIIGPDILLKPEQFRVLT